MDAAIEEIHRIRREMAERWEKMTPEEVDDDFRRNVNSVRRQLGKPELPRRETAVCN